MCPWSDSQFLLQIALTSCTAESIKPVDERTRCGHDRLHALCVKQPARAAACWAHENAPHGRRKGTSCRAMSQLNAPYRRRKMVCTSWGECRMQGAADMRTMVVCRRLSPKETHCTRSPQFEVSKDPRCTHQPKPSMGWTSTAAGVCSSGEGSTMHAATYTHEGIHPKCEVHAVRGASS